MSSLNQVNLIGRIGGDPELRHLPNGEAVANCTLATSERWKDKQTGEQKEQTEWHRLSFYGKLAEIVGQYVSKGSLIYVSGSLRTRKWQAQDGTDRYTTEIKCDQMRMLGGKGDNAGQGRDANNNPQQQRPQNASRPQPAQQPKQNDYDQDIPF
ncbi:Single-stranded DNA-binding protein [compost metagenome]